MDRRDTVLALLTLVAVPIAAQAQRAARAARIGYLSPNLASSPRLRDAFLQGLRDLGYEVRGADEFDSWASRSPSWCWRTRTR